MPRRRLSLPKKILFSAVTTIVVLVLLELALMAIGIQPVLFEEDPYVGFSSSVPLFVERTGDDSTAVMETGKNKLAFFNSQQFPRDKHGRTVRIFCMGGSTTYGRPYDDRASFCAWLRAFVREADPSRRWEVINAGGISYASYRVALVMEELVRYEPDVFVIYSGHNEFLERRTYGQIIGRAPALGAPTALAARTRIYTAVKKAIDGVRDLSQDAHERRTVLGGEVKTRLDNTVGPRDYTRDDAMKSKVLEHYRYNLGRMVDIARSVGAAVVMIVPASNLRDCSPFRSQHREGLTVGDYRRWVLLYARAEKAYKDRRFEDALAAIGKATAIDERYAHSHYLQGRALYALRRTGAAKSAFERAIEEDVCPLRALGAMRRIVTEVAAERQVPLVDFAALAEKDATDGIPGKDLFFDHVHPRPHGNRRLALAVLDKLIGENIVAPASDWGQQAIDRVTADVTSRLDAPGARALALLNLSKVLGWAGKYEEAGHLAKEALSLDPYSPEAQCNYASSLRELGAYEEAAVEYAKAIKLRPNYVEAHGGFSYVLMKLKKFAEAEAHARRAIRLAPKDVRRRAALAEILRRQGKYDQSVATLQEALVMDPEFAPAHNVLGRIFLTRGRPARAVTHLERAVALRPDNAGYHLLLGNALKVQGKPAAAVDQFEQSIWIRPDNPMALNNLAWLLATSSNAALRNGARAVELAEYACEVTDHKNAGLLDTLSAAYAEAGRFDRAIATAATAVELAKSSGNDPLAREISDRLKLYQDRKPFRPER